MRNGESSPGEGHYPEKELAIRSALARIAGDLIRQLRWKARSGSRRAAVGHFWPGEVSSLWLQLSRRTLFRPKRHPLEYAGAAVHAGVAGLTGWCLAWFRR